MGTTFVMFKARVELASLLELSLFAPSEPHYVFKYIINGEVGLDFLDHKERRLILSFTKRMIENF